MHGPTALYAYGYPYYWSANTHRERSNTATMLTLKDSAQMMYVMYIIDMAWDGSGGSMDLDVVASGSIIPSSGRRLQTGKDSAASRLVFVCATLSASQAY